MTRRPGWRGSRALVPRLALSEIIARHADGATLAELADASGASVNWVRSQLILHGVDTCRTRRRSVTVSRLSDEAICQRYCAGESRADLAIHAGVSEGKIRRTLERAGVPLRPWREANALAARSPGSFRERCRTAPSD